ncbi:DUF192 domain-containing protein [Haloprofundus salinisoli]|uniref:DUF192 domain-containing protein n=1 Tax=Haloprofundus salinisoli TaxID=2876193 RepID=UPI001CCCCDC7|nr:DUF192 domain-containing protein [Haloprofundus salinisoli]
MQLVHEGRPIARTVEFADGFLQQSRGLMFRRSVPDDYALVFRFDEAERRSLHMLFVPFPIDALWMVDGEVTKRARLSGWTGLGWGIADTIVELPAGAADGVDEGDSVELVE